MAKTVTKRVAKSGKRTADGRAIERVWLEQAAKNYAIETYAARVFLEHIRGISPDWGFKVYGTVNSLSIEDASNGEVYLVAEIEPHPDLIAWWNDGQKRAFSIEIIEDFADLKSAYMVGLAVTDSPASLGTHFVHQSEPNSLSIRIDTQDDKQDNNMTVNVEQFTDSLKHFSSEIEVLRAERDSLKAEINHYAKQLSEHEASQEAILAAAQEKYTSDMAEKDEKIAALKEQIPAAHFNFRPVITGGDGSHSGLIY